MVTALARATDTFPATLLLPASTSTGAMSSATLVLADAPPVLTSTTKSASTTLRSILTSTCESPLPTAAASAPEVKRSIQLLCMSQWLCQPYYPRYGRNESNHKLGLS